MSNFRFEDGKGRIFENLERTNDRAPKFSGKATIGDLEYKVAAWYNTPRSGDEAPSYGLRFEPLDEHKSRAQEQPPNRDENPW
jgi:hypothetical protein